MNLRRLLCVLLGAVLALVVLSPPATAVTTIQLTGTVTNTDGVNQDGTVCLELVGSGSCSGNPLTAGAWSRTWNDVDNTPGDYLVRVISSTMDNTSRWYVAGDNAGTTTKALATPVHLAAGEPDFSFTMVMPAIAKVSGRVIDTGGVGVANLPVLLNQSGLVRQTVTNALGNYDLGYTRAGSWQIFVNGGDTYAGTQTGVVVPATGSVVVPDLTVQLAADISGQVTDSVTDHPIPFIYVEAYTASEPRNYLGSAVTDVAGHYRIDGLGNTPLVLRFTDDKHDGYVRTLNNGGDPVDWSPQTPITLAENESRVYDQALVPSSPPPPPAHNLSGTVTDADDRPLAGIQVTFGDLTDMTDRLGRWYIDAPDGTHLLGFAADASWSTAFLGEPSWAPESYPGRLVSSAATPVTVSGGVGAAGLDIRLVRSVTSTATPVIAGAAEPGQTLSATTGSWAAPVGTTFATAWLRDGVVVGAGATYLVQAADAGRTILARVTATFGAAVSQASSAPRRVSRLATATTARGRSPQTHKVRIKVKVSALGLTPTGTLTILRSGKVVKTGVTLVGGRATILLRRQPSGWRRYSVTFDGAAQTLSSSSPTFRVKVL